MNTPRWQPWESWKLERMRKLDDDYTISSYPAGYLDTREVLTDCRGCGEPLSLDEMGRSYCGSCRADRRAAKVA